MWGIPPQGRADYAFFQHIAKSLDPTTGRSAILLPHGVLFRRDEATMRERLIKSDLVECVLGLGEGLFYNSPMPAVVIILRTRKPAERQGKVLFINALNEVSREQGQAFLRETHQQKILDAYRSFANLKQFATVATLDEIAAKGFSLAISTYVEDAVDSDEGEQIDLAEALAAWRTAAQISDTTVVDVLSLMRTEAST
jgi:type I restriction enzyme M protein